MQLNKQAAKADDNQAKLQGLRKSHLARPPLRWTCWVCAGKEEGKKSPSQRTRGAEPPTVMAALKAKLSCQYFNRIGGNCQQKTSLTKVSGGGIINVERALPAGGRLPWLQEVTVSFGGRNGYFLLLYICITRPKRLIMTKQNVSSSVIVIGHLLLSGGETVVTSSVMGGDRAARQGRAES